MNVLIRFESGLYEVVFIPHNKFFKLYNILFTTTWSPTSTVGSIEPEEEWVECESCGGGWRSYMHSKRIEEPKLFRDSPLPQGYDRRIRE